MLLEVKMPKLMHPQEKLYEKITQFNFATTAMNNNNDNNIVQTHQASKRVDPQRRGDSFHEGQYSNWTKVQQ